LTNLKVCARRTKSSGCRSRRSVHIINPINKTIRRHVRKIWINRHWINCICQPRNRHASVNILNSPNRTRVPLAVCLVPVRIYSTRRREHEAIRVEISQPTIGERDAGNDCFQHRPVVDQIPQSGRQGRNDNFFAQPRLGQRQDALEYIIFRNEFVVLNRTEWERL